MGQFDDEDFNGEFGDDFFGRWEEFNRMMNDRQFKGKVNRFQKDIEDLMRLIANSRENGTPLRFNLIPLNPENMDKLGLTNPFDDSEIKKGQDENGNWETKNWTSPDGSISYSSFTRSSNMGENHPDDLADAWDEKLRDRRTKRTNTEESKKLKLAKLQRTLDYLVEGEQYEKAAEIKKMMDELSPIKKVVKSVKKEVKPKKEK
jgi:hypothetical protein